MTGRGEEGTGKVCLSGEPGSVTMGRSGLELPFLILSLSEEVTRHEPTVVTRNLTPSTPDPSSYRTQPFVLVPSPSQSLENNQPSSENGVM